MAAAFVVLSACATVAIGAPIGPFSHGQLHPRATVKPSARSSERTVLRVRRRTLRWTAAQHTFRYLLAAVPRQGRTVYRVIPGSSFTPPAVPGQSVKYAVRRLPGRSSWSNSVTIKYAAGLTSKVANASAVPAPASIALTPGNPAQVTVSSAGATSFHVAVMTDASADGSEYTCSSPNTGCPLGQDVVATNGVATYTPPTDHPWVAVQPIENGVGGNWTARVQTSPAPPPPSETTLPVISGTTQLGSVLSATTGGWSNSPTGYSYQWQDCGASGASCANITGATSSSYTLAPNDIGHTIDVVVTARNAGGSSGVTAAYVGPVTNVPANAAIALTPGNPAQVTVSSAGATSFHVAVMTDASADGSEYTCSSPNTGCPLGQDVVATNGVATYTPPTDHPWVAVQPIENGVGGNWTARVQTSPAPPPPSETTLPVISGTTQLGSVLSATTGGWSNSPTGYSYQWQDCGASGASCANITGATSSSYTLAPNDIGHTIDVVVTARNAGGSSGVTAAYVGPVTNVPANAAIALTPGNPAQVTVSSAGATSFHVAVMTDASADGSEYTCSSPNTGCPLGQDVVATNGVATYTPPTDHPWVAVQPIENGVGGNWTARVQTSPAPPPPSETTLPVISGTTQLGSVLSATTGGWSNSPTGYSYQWQDCGASGASCANITGATSSSYTLAPNDIGHTIDVVVTARNAGGSSGVTAAYVGPVTNVPANAAIALTPGNPAQVTVSSAGATSFHVAVMTDASADGSEYTCSSPNTGCPLGQDVVATNGVATYTPPTDHPWVAVQPIENGVGGNWTAPVQTSPAPPPPVSNSPFMLGINPGGGSCCGTSVDSGMLAAGIGYARVDPNGGMGPASDFVGVGMKVNLNISGDCSGSSPTGYSSGSVSAINAAGWASCAVAVWKNVCQASTVKCPSLEELNEPGGSWFWGTNANTQAAADNYALLIEDTWNAFHNTYGASCDTAGTCPLLLASFDGGGEDGDLNWGQKVFANSSGIPVNNYVNGWTDHPYGDDSNAQGGCGGEGTGLSAAAADNYDISMSNVTTTHSIVGSKPIYLTEVGWQTGSGECSGQQQADNLYGLFQWAKSAGYIGGIFVFNYSDFSGDAFGMVGNTQAGNETIQGQKPAWTAIQQVAANQPCSVC